MIGVVGLGAVGSLFVHFLNQGGITPYVITRRCVEYTFCSPTCRQLQFVPTSELPPVKYTVVAVKAYDSAAAAVHVGGLAVVAQNGVGGLEAIRERHRAVPAVVTYGVYREGCRSELRGVGEIVLPREAEELGEWLRRGGAVVKIVDDVEPYRWLKLAVNAAINAITAVLQRENGVVAESPHAGELAAAVAREAAAVAAALGVKLPADPVEEVYRVAAATARNLSSTARDIRLCLKTEVDYINGAVVKYGERLGVATPYNKALYLLVKTLEERCG
ncbi:MAG: ketopantoate reductase family protein [Pyrobaculum sp.]